jgi:hypothetical protein
MKTFNFCRMTKCFSMEFLNGESQPPLPNREIVGGQAKRAMVGGSPPHPGPLFSFLFFFLFFLHK